MGFHFPVAASVFVALLRSRAVWGSWRPSAGVGPWHISLVVDVEEKDAAGSWLIFFFSFSSLSGALDECSDIFQPQAVFQNLFVCEICAAQHNQAACATSQLGAAFGTVLKVKPVF